MDGNTKCSEKYWRVRMNPSEGNESKAAWDRREVGIWYGAWSAKDFFEAGGLDGDARGVLDHLNSLPAQKEIVWDVTKNSVDTARRFASITARDWVVAYFDRVIHLARIEGELLSNQDHPLNRRGEIFKYRRIIDAKEFRLSLLPDCFLLLATAGRGNVHEFNETNYKLVKILSEAKDESDAIARIENMSFKDWLDILGPSAWESLCESYLILMHQFVPTGLSIGRTLSTFDIVGTDRDENKILAQCKKGMSPETPSVEFLEACRSYRRCKPCKVYFFAYGGCKDVPAWVNSLDRNTIAEWFETAPEGQWLKERLRS